MRVCLSLEWQVTEKSLNIHNYVIKQLLCVQQIVKCESVLEPGVAGNREIFRQT